VFAWYAVWDIDYFGIRVFLWFIVFLLIKAVNSSVMSSNIGVMPWLPHTQDQKLLTLHWRSSSDRGREHVAVVLAPKGSQYLINGYLQPIRTEITQDANLNIIDPPLLLILRMGQWPCYSLCCLFKLLISRLCISSTKSPFNYRTYKNKNRWCSVDAHFQSVAVILSVSLLPMKAANMLVMHNSEQISAQIPYLQDRKLLMLRWHSIEAPLMLHWHSGDAAVMIILGGRGVVTNNIANRGG